MEGTVGGQTAHRTVELMPLVIWIQNATWLDDDIKWQQWHMSDGDGYNEWLWLKFWLKIMLNISPLVICCLHILFIIIMTNRRDNSHKIVIMFGDDKSYFRLGFYHSCLCSFLCMKRWPGKLSLSLLCPFLLQSHVKYKFWVRWK